MSKIDIKASKSEASEYKPCINNGFIDVCVPPCSHGTHFLTVRPKSVVVLTTGLYFEIPLGYFGKIEPLTAYARLGLVILGGILDSDYRGEIKVLCSNVSTSDIILNIGDLFARIIIFPYMTVDIQYVKTLSTTARGASGFGSTSINMFKNPTVSSTCKLTRGTEGSCGYDIEYTGKDLIISNKVTELDLGCSFFIPDGYIGLFEARSSLGLKGLKLIVNSFDLTKGKNIILYCFSASSDIFIKTGTRFAQLILVPKATNGVLQKCQRG